MGDLGATLRRLAGPEPDGQLLARFTAARDDAAFAELVRRHGPMVLAACRRVLGPDADDAFQATYIVLARKAGSVRDARTLGNWLYGVARRTAMRQRDAQSRRQHHESQATRPTSADSEFLAAVDEELERLSDRYRRPLVACLLEGRTQEDAARELGLSLSSLRRLLDRGRGLLRDRLTRRGVVPAVALSLLGTADVTPALATETVRLTFSAGDSAAAALAKGVLSMMARSKLGTAFVVLGVTGFAAVAWQLAVAQSPKSVQSTQEEAKQKDPEKRKVDERIKVGDYLYLKAVPSLPTNPLDGPFKVVGDGIDLGGEYGGDVRVVGLTIEEARKAIEKQLLLYLKRTTVSLA